MDKKNTNNEKQQLPKYAGITQLPLPHTQVNEQSWVIKKHKTTAIEKECLPESTPVVDNKSVYLLLGSGRGTTTTAKKIAEITATTTEICKDEWIPTGGVFSIGNSN